MTFRVYVVTLLGLFTSLWTVFAILTPLVPPFYHQYGLRDPAAAIPFLPTRERAARVRKTTSRAVLLECAELDWSSVNGFWTPTISEAVTTDAALAAFLAELIALPHISPMDSMLLATRNDARQMIGVYRLIESRSILINGYEPDSGDGEGFVTECGDPRWRWSIEYTPGAGFHHFSMFRNCW